MRRLWRLFRSNWRLALAALFIVGVIRVALWVLPFRRIHRWIEKSGSSSGSDDVLRRMRIARAVSVVSRFVPGASCLTQALAAQWLLRRRGEDAKLCFGIARSPSGAMEAHAWLEHDGGVLIGDLPNLHDYRRFQTLSAIS